MIDATAAAGAAARDNTLADLYQADPLKFNVSFREKVTNEPRESLWTVDLYRMTTAGDLDGSALPYSSEKFLDMRWCPRCIVLTTNDQSGSGDRRKPWTKVELERSSQDSPHEVLVRVHDHVYEKFEFARVVWAPCQQGANHTCGEFSVGRPSDPIVHGLAPVMLHPEYPRTGPDQDELLNPAGVRSGERLRRNPTHRVADDAAPIDVRRIEEASHRCR